MNVSASRVRLLKVWEILLHYSSEEHPLKTNEIIDLLVDSNQYCDRRTLYNDIKLLNETGFKVVTLLKEHSNCYYVPNKLEKDDIADIVYLIENSDYIEDKKSIMRYRFLNTVLG